MIYLPRGGGPGQVGHLNVQLELYELILEFNQLRSNERPPQAILQGGVDAGLDVIGIYGDARFEEEVVKFSENEVRVLDAFLCASKTIFVPAGISFVPCDQVLEALLMTKGHLQAVDQAEEVMFGAVSGLDVFPEGIGEAKSSVDATKDGHRICHGGAGCSLVLGSNRSRGRRCQVRV